LVGIIDTDIIIFFIFRSNNLSKSNYLKLK